MLCRLLLPVTLFVIIILMLFAYIAHRNFAKKYTNGTWIDTDGNVLVMNINKKIKVSFGINTNGDEYELAENEYNYSISKKWLSSQYVIKLKNGMSILIDPISGIATVYDKKKKVGKFAKNNLLLLG